MRVDIVHMLNEGGLVQHQITLDLIKFHELDGGDACLVMKQPSAIFPTVEGYAANIQMNIMEVDEDELEDNVGVVTKIGI